jgi:hypothetical protein
LAQVSARTCRLHCARASVPGSALMAWSPCCQSCTPS